MPVMRLRLSSRWAAKLRGLLLQRLFSVLHVFASAVSTGFAGAGLFNLVFQAIFPPALFGRWLFTLLAQYRGALAGTGSGGRTWGAGFSGAAGGGSIALGAACCGTLAHSSASAVVSVFWLFQFTPQVSAPSNNRCASNGQGQRAHRCRLGGRRKLDAVRGCWSWQVVAKTVQTMDGCC